MASEETSVLEASAFVPASKALLGGDKTGLFSELVGLLSLMGTGSEAAQKIATTAVQSAFRHRVQSVLEREYKALEQEEQQQAFIDATCAKVADTVVRALTSTSSSAFGELEQQLSDIVFLLTKALQEQSATIWSTVDDAFEKATVRTERLFARALRDDRDRRDTGYEGAYMRKIARAYESMQSLGARHVNDFRPPLSVAYVSLRLEKLFESLYGTTDAEGVLVDEPLLTVRGPAGSGKTTLLRWVALQCARGYEQETTWSGGVPFFIPLRALAEDDAAYPRPVDFIKYTLEGRSLAEQPPTDWIARVLREKRAMILIDGVDELAVEQRPAFWRWLSDFCEEYPDNHVIITSRFFPEVVNGEYLWNPPVGFTHAQVQPMSDHDVEQFVLRWHQAAVDSVGEDEDEQLRLRAAQKSLLKQLSSRGNKRVRQLARTPLLCALICALHRVEEGYLPSRRIKLYEKCCDMLIDERDRKRNIPPPPPPLCYLDKGDKEMALMHLAISMMRNTVAKADASSGTYHIEVSRDDAEHWITGAISSFKDERARTCTAAGLVDMLLARSGLLREPVAGKIDFPHRAFQEYFAACAAGMTLSAGELASRAGDDRWHETIVLAAGTHIGGAPFGKALIERLLRRAHSGKRTDEKDTCLALAVACLETAPYVGDKLREEVLRNLDRLVPPTSLDHAKSLAAAGEAIVPYLTHEHMRTQDEKVQLACCCTLILVSTPKSLREVEAYLHAHERDTLGGSAVIYTDNRFAAKVLFLPGIDLQETSFPHVTELNLSGWRATDLSPLVTLPNLQFLDLSGAGQVDLSPLSGLTTLEHLRLIRAGVHDIKHLEGLSSLQHLNLRGTKIRSCAALSGMEELVDLSLQGTRITALPSDARFPRLRRLDLRGTPVDSLGAVLGSGGAGVSERFGSLHELDLSHTRIKSIEEIGALSGLTRLHLAYTGITDLGPLAQLSELEELDLSHTHVDDVSSIAALPNLARLNLSFTRVSDVQPLREARSLRHLDVGHAPVQDFSALDGRKGLVIRSNPPNSRRRRG